jgi:hypothetical protein
MMNINVMYNNNYMEQSPSQEAKSHFASQKIPPSPFTEPEGSVPRSQEPAKSKALCNIM